GLAPEVHAVARLELHLVDGAADVARHVAERAALDVAGDAHLALQVDAVDLRRPEALAQARHLVHGDELPPAAALAHGAGHEEPRHVLARGPPDHWQPHAHVVRARLLVLVVAGHLAGDEGPQHLRHLADADAEVRGALAVDAEAQLGLGLLLADLR